MLWRAGDLFRWITEGRLSVRVGGRYPLEQAAQAQADLASRGTTGKLLLLPGEAASVTVVAACQLGLAVGDPDGNLATAAGAVEAAAGAGAGLVVLPGTVRQRVRVHRRRGSPRPGQPGR